MSQIRKKYISANAVDETKIRLSNDAALRARNAADSADINILKVNGSDRIEFSSLPQVTADPVAANDLVRKSYLDAALEGLKPKEAVRATATSNVVIASALEDGDVLDGVTLATGNRVLLIGQTDPIENGIYVVQASGAALRSSDMNLSSEIPGAYTVTQEGTANAGKAYVCTVLGTFVLGTDPMTFVLFKSAATLNAGDGISISGDTVSVDLDTDPGLEFNSAKLRAKVDAAGAISRGASGLAVNLEASNPSLQIASNELGVKLFSGGAVVKGASGVGVNLEASNPTLQISSNELGLKMNAAGALQTSATGVQVRVDAATVKINGSNNLEALKPNEEIITLSAGDITNQYIDLAQVAYSAASVRLCPVGGIPQERGVDFTVSLTGGAGGVTRVTFAGDLATGGAAELIATDKLMINYSFI